MLQNLWFQKKKYKCSVSVQRNSFLAPRLFGREIVEFDVLVDLVVESIGIARKRAPYNESA